jgi:2-oxoglutarate ferredoxin oxidoreductase subunit alpha
VNMEIKDAWDKMAPDIEEHETYGKGDAKVLVIAHGIVSQAAKAAIDATGEKARLWRPITLNPFPKEALIEAVRGVDTIILAESAINQLARIVRDALYDVPGPKMVEYFKPSIGIFPDEIKELIEKA